MAAGTVTASGLISGYGNHVVITHGEGWTSLYGHMASASPLRVGQSVGAGSYVGPVGTTGNSTGPHLHLQLELNGVPQDPAPLIRVDALAPNPPRYPTTPPEKKEKDMFVLKTIGNLNEVPSGYTALVGIRTLRHLDADQVALIRAAGVDYYERVPADFYKTISALGIPRAALVVNADYAREYTD